LEDINKAKVSIVLKCDVNMNSDVENEIEEDFSGLTSEMPVVVVNILSDSTYDLKLAYIDK